MLGSVEIKTRPLRFAFIIDRGSADQVRAAIRLGSTLWGGIYSPIVQLFRRMPATWRDHGLPAPPAKAVVSGYLEAFDPDVLVQLSSHLPAYVSTTGRQVITPADIWEQVRQGNSRNPAYGIGILDARARELGLAEEEVAFYDAVAENAKGVYDEPFLRDLVHDVVQTIKRNLKVDWTEPHRDQVRAEIRTAVKRVLRKRNVREADFEPFIARFIQQAAAQYAEWPLVA